MEHDGGANVALINVWFVKGDDADWASPKLNSDRLPNERDVTFSEVVSLCPPSHRRQCDQRELKLISF